MHRGSEALRLSAGARGVVADRSLSGTTDTLGERVGAASSIPAAIRLAIELGRELPSPATGRTRSLWEAMATVAAADLTVARVIEPHLDALAILHQSDGAKLDGIAAADASWGVFAAEGGERPLSAATRGAGFTLTGTKPWCSLAGSLTNALVTAHTDGGRRLFAVDLRAPGVSVRADSWVARGLTDVPSGPVDFSSVAAVPVGDDGWYLTRPGFFWGAIGVAAIWWGGAVGIARGIDAHVRSRAADGRADAIDHMLLGGADIALETARSALADAAGRVDEPIATGHRDHDRVGSRILAQRTRSTVVLAAERILQISAHLRGPAPLALDADHARRVADLELYLRQDHAEKDEAALGRALVEQGEPTW